MENFNKEKAFDPSVLTAQQLEEVVESCTRAVTLLAQVLEKMSHIANFDLDNRRIKEFKASGVAVDALMYGVYLHRRDALLAVHELIAMSETRPKRPMSNTTRTHYVQLKVDVRRAELVSSALRTKYERVA